jgi:hypothetical protein
MPSKWRGSYYIENPYQPRKRNAALLDRALEHVTSVPYNVTLRFVFYRLVTDGLVKKSLNGYGRLTEVTTKARYAKIRGWNEWTLTDSTRRPQKQDSSHDTVEDFLGELVESVEIDLNRHRGASRPIILYEANAMTSQFQHYTKNYHCDLFPFGGQPSIQYKWRIFHKIIDIIDNGQIPVIFYAGDLDKAGLDIEADSNFVFNSWMGKYRKDWGKLRWNRIGLDQEQVDEFKIPTQEGGKEAYQWEALTDQQAGEVITEALDNIVNKDMLLETTKLCEAASKQLKSYLSEFKYNSDL